MTVTRRFTILAVMCFRILTMSHVSFKKLDMQVFQRRFLSVICLVGFRCHKHLVNFLPTWTNNPPVQVKGTAWPGKNIDPRPKFGRWMTISEFVLLISLRDFSKKPHPCCFFEITFLNSPRYGPPTAHMGRQPPLFEVKRVLQELCAFLRGTMHSWAMFFVKLKSWSFFFFKEHLSFQVSRTHSQ